jgi:hypothetical protein
MRNLLLIFTFVICCSCLATSGEIDRAIADITGRIDVVARDAQESSEAARAAWQRGEISYAELEKRLQDIRAATLGTAKETAETVLEGVKEAIEQRPAEAIKTGTEMVGGLLPGPWGEVLALAGAAAAAAFARREAQRVNRERDAARAARGESVANPTKR